VTFSSWVDWDANCVYFEDFNLAPRTTCGYDDVRGTDKRMGGSSSNDDDNLESVGRTGT